MGKIYSYIIGLIVGLILGVLFSVNHYRTEASTCTRDTTIITDTIFLPEPVKTSEKAIGSVTRRLAKAETARNNRAEQDADTAAWYAAGLDADSVTVEIPITQAVYEDSLFKAYVSGFEPRLDSIFVFPRTEIVTITRTAEPHGTGRMKRWGLGVQVGCGWNGKVQPYVGVGVSYNILVW